MCVKHRNDINTYLKWLWVIKNRFWTGYDTLLIFKIKMIWTWTTRTGKSYFWSIILQIFQKSYALSVLTNYLSRNSYCSSIMRKLHSFQIKMIKETPNHTIEELLPYNFWYMHYTQEENNIWIFDEISIQHQDHSIKNRMRKKFKTMTIEKLQTADSDRVA